LKKLFLFVFIICQFISNGQTSTNKMLHTLFAKPVKYVSFNPLALTEPQMAIGIGFGNRFTERSEYFAELSYVTKTIFYNTDVDKLNGFRFLGQYRYHFLQLKQTAHSFKRWKRQPFVALEFRLKNYLFPTKNTFVNYSILDTISNLQKNANAISIGGAILFGASYHISKNNKWKLDVTAGIGAKQKFVEYKNLSNNYETIRLRKPDALGPPKIYEEVGMPYFPIAVRIKHFIN
jgi:hypothetical protein